MLECIVWYGHSRLECIVYSRLLGPMKKSDASASMRSFINI